MIVLSAEEWNTTATSRSHATEDAGHRLPSGLTVARSTTARRQIDDRLTRDEEEEPMPVRLVRSLAMMLVVLRLGTASAAAQITTGTVTGTIKDIQGGVVPG